eukprot:TRINITY_DN1186_c0_g1_i5.p1 TRINITY_DN1186_c0_g1~~TRINITY_DN1186_c0_g1_i5.p1  ORF type:complete len:227 (-),score=36.48 TRINITY_DN1186_c0_g1_i5:189-869(-)
MKITTQEMRSKFDKHVHQLKLFQRSASMYSIQLGSELMVSRSNVQYHPLPLYHDLPSLMSRQKLAVRKREFIKSTLDRQGTMENKRPRITRGDPDGLLVTISDLDTLISRLVSIHMHLSIETLKGDSGTVEGLVIIYKKNYHIVVVFTKPIIETSSTPLVIYRLNFLGKNEPISAWIPSELQSFRNLSHKLSSLVLENRVRYPQEQLPKLIENLNRIDFFHLLEIC